MNVTAVTDGAYAVVLGLFLGLGIALLATLLPRWGSPSLVRRIAPYIRDVTDAAGTTISFGRTGSASAAWWHELQRRAVTAGGGSVSVQRRLRQAGWSMDAAAFRGRQLAWAIAGVVFGGVAVVGLVLLGRGSAQAALIPPLCGVAAAVIYDARLTRAARARVRRIEEELPTVLEFVALCLSAGEGILDSLRRVSAVGAGELTSELRTSVLAVGTGSALSEALARLGQRLEIAALSRSVDQLIAAIDRGAPLALVLHAQASDAREDAKRTLIEQAGRKEIYMLVPLVFLILPLSVLFAVFPGILMLRLGIG
jgi:tight adherence protein C